MLALLRENPLLLLFVVSAVGFPIGQIRVKGVSLGVSAVLFAGLAAGALDARLKLPDIVYELGLALFVYSVGLAGGRGFFGSFRRKGLRDNAFVLGCLVGATALVAGLGLALGLPRTLTTGVFCGSTTNTPALAAALEMLKQRGGAGLDDALAQVVVGYSVSYPLGVLGAILSFAVVSRVLRADFAAEARASGRPGAGDPLDSRTVEVTQSDSCGVPLGELVRSRGFNVAFGRHRRGDVLGVAAPDTVLELGDDLVVVGTRADLARAVAGLGRAGDEPLELDRSELDFRRVFVSSHAVAGKEIGELDLPRRFGAIVTRVRRGDEDVLPHDDTMLELGDRVRVVAPRARMTEVSAFFGDSYRAVSEVDILTFSAGLALGLLVGRIPIPLPGGLTVSLGFAGGPLVVALVLGAVSRTGRLLWTVPYGANLTLRQLGVVLFLAGIGTRAGGAFLATLRGGDALPMLGAGAAVTVAASVVLLVVGHRALRIPMAQLGGMLAGLQTQPAVLGFALDQAKNELPSSGYARVYPTVLVAKIILAQLLLALT